MQKIDFNGFSRAGKFLGKMAFPESPDPRLACSCIAIMNALTFCPPTRCFR